MASEDIVSFHIMRHLQSLGWKIIQYHPPGGQASMAIYLGKKHIVPDIIACKNNAILVTENKGRFSLQDIQKLEKIRTSPEAIEQLKDFAVQYRKAPILNEVAFYWLHGYSGRVNKTTNPFINLAYVKEDGVVIINPAKTAPAPL